MVQRCSKVSLRQVWVIPGDDSVSPYTLVMVIYIFSLTCFISSIGQSEPAMIPVRRQLRSNIENIGWFNSAINIVGTP